MSAISDSSDPFAELRALLTATVFDDASEAGRARLNELLKSDVEARRYASQFFEVECVLHRQFEMLNRVVDFHLPPLAVAQSELDSADVQCETPGTRDWSLSKKVKYWLAICATCGALIVGWNLYPRPQQGPDRVQALEGIRMPVIVATLQSEEGADWREVAYHEGAELREGSRLNFANGLVKVNLPSGVELLLQGPCDVVIHSPNQIRLREGRLSVRAAEWASEFVIETSLMKVVNLGPQFSVFVSPDGASEAHVLEGQVRIQPVVDSDESRRSFVLEAGQAVRVSPSGKGPTRLAARFDSFVTKHGEFRPYRPIEIFNSGQGLAVGDEDRNWRIVDGPIGAAYKGPQYAVVCETDKSYLSNQPIVSQWLSVAKNLRPGCLSNSIYTFQTECDLNGYDLSSIVILADILADNGVKSVRINGKPVDIVPWQDNVYNQEFNRFRRAEITKGFLPGKNVIEIDIWNGVYSFPGSSKEKGNVGPNPMALRVEWRAFGKPLVQPPGTVKTI